MADRWFDPALATRGALAADLPDPGHPRLPAGDAGKHAGTAGKTPDEDEALYFYRMALFHEDLRCEELVALAQTLGVPLSWRCPWARRASRSWCPPRAGRWAVARRLRLGRGEWAHEVEVPEFEIDAQPVNWAQYVEFVDDGGYDRPEIWLPQGWAWLQREAVREGRRGPRHVEQIGVASGAVLQTLFGKPARMAGSQGAMHVSWWEADAWARWAGRRLPTEVEWEIAAHKAARRGFRWGDVREWTAGTLRPWPGFQPAPWAGHRTGSASRSSARPGAAWRVVRDPFAHEASEVPRVCDAGTR